MNPTAEKDIAYSKSIISGFFVHPTGLLAWSNNNGAIGQYLLLKGEYKESVKYSKIACDYYSTNTKGVGISDPLNALAMAKILSNDYDSVAAYLAIAEKDAVVTKQNDVLAYGIQIQALYKIKMGDLIEAERLLLKCWQLIREFKLPVGSGAGILAPDYYLAMIRMQQNKFTDAIDLLKKDIIRLERNRLEILKDYKLLGELYEKIGDDNASKKTYKSFIALQDSLLTDQKKYSSVSFETEQEMNAKELSITKLQSENKLSSITRNFTIGIAALLLILAATVYYRFKTKQKANTVLEKTLTDLKPLLPNASFGEMRLVEAALKATSQNF